MGLRHRLAPNLSVVAVVLALVGSLLTAVPAAAAAPPSGHRVLTGRDAANFRIPADVRLITSWRDARRGLTFDRYQQVAAPFGAHVKGSQLTVVSHGERQVLVIGAHYPGQRADLLPLLQPAGAVGRALADRQLLRDVPDDLVAGLRHRTELRIDPASGRLFYLVESGTAGVHVFHEVDARTGAVIDAWDAIHRANGMGTGVKGDRKSLLGAGAGAADDLTSRISGAWRMRSVDGDIVTYDAKRRGLYGPGSGIQPLSDNAKSKWRNNNDWSHAYQRPGVDAQYYTALTRAFYQDHFGFDPVDDCPYGGIRNVVHFDPFPWDGYGWDNAFWDGFDGYLVFGDGDGYWTRALSSALDVVSHELTHAVTQCRASLDYQDESGALNEAFSDIIATAAEWDTAEPLSSNCRRAAGQAVCADWWMGEDAIVGGPYYAFRNLADPALEDQPRHYSELQYIGEDYDNGGVHVNNGVPNHAFFLMVEGGRNARCSGPADADADCDVFVPPIGLADAEQIAFTAWGLLGEDALMCEARDATVAAAGLLFPGSDAHRASAELAWAAVGLGAAQCDPAVTDYAISLAIRSIALATGSSGQLQLSLVRGTQGGAINFAVSGSAPATTTVTPGQSPGSGRGDGTVITLDVAADAPSGAYPLIARASDGTTTRYAAAVLIVDAEAPALQVSGVRIPSKGSVSTAGVAPLQVTWTASDAGSGVDAAQLEHSPNGTDWTPIAGPTGSGQATSWSTTAGAHHFRVSGGDTLGNSGTSDVVARTLSVFQQTAVNYTGSWSSNSVSTPWGATRYAKKAGASATFNFTGTDVAWVAQRGPKRGKAKVYLDGKLTWVDLRANNLSERRIVFSATNLAAGPHKLKIVVRGTSGRPRVDIDGFLVLSP